MGWALESGNQDSTSSTGDEGPRGYVTSLCFKAISLLTKKKGNYAYNYDCPQVFILNLVSLLILQFKAQHKNEILRHDCAINYCLIPVKLMIPN
jgi:hypothetical protein